MLVGLRPHRFREVVGMPPSPGRAGNRILAAGALGVLAALSAYASLVFVPQERAAAVAACRADRQSVAVSRTEAIGMWVDSRLGDAATLAAVPAVERLLRRPAAVAPPSAGADEVSTWLEELGAHHGARALVVDGALRVVAPSAAAGALDAALAPVARAALAGRAPIADFVRDGTGRTTVVFARPVDPARARPGGGPSGVVLVLDDPAVWLYPYLTERLGSSSTGESLLVRRDGDDAVFLSPLRKDPGSPLLVRRPLSSERFAAAQGLQGSSGFGEYLDYQGVPVFAELRRIRGAGWLLVAKIDRAEALAPLHSRLRALGVASAVLLSALVGIALLYRRAHRASRAAEVAAATARLNARFRIAAESVSDVVYEWDLGERVEWFGDVDGLLGWGPGEYPRTAAGHVASIHPDDVDGVMAAVERHRRGEGPYDVEYRVRRRDGSYAWWAVRGTAVRDARGVPVHWVGAASDVSGKKADEERLLHLNAVLRAIRDVNQAIVREKDARALLARVCESLVEARGYHGAWILVLAGQAAGHMASAGIDAHAAEMRARLESGETLECARRAMEGEGVQAVLAPGTECGSCPLAAHYSGRAGLSTRVAHGGRTLAVLCVSAPNRFAGDPEERELLNEVAGDLGLALQSIDTERERAVAERGLRVAEQVLNASIAALSVADRDGRITRVNPAFVSLWGLGLAEHAVGRSVASFFADPGEAGGVLAALDRQGRWEGEFRARRADGSIFACRGLATALHDAEGNFVGYQSTNIDVTEQRRAEEALAASERKYRHFFEQGLAGHYVSARDGRLVSCNNAFARLLGFASAAEAVGSDVVGFYATPARREEFLRRLNEQGRVDRLETELLRRDGRSVWVLESAVEVAGEGGAPGEIHGFVIDDTERRTAHEEFLQAQKMEAIGRLAGGVAHDFNNLLGVILGHAELLLRRCSADAAVAAELDQVRLAAERGGRLTRQLLAFSRRQVLQPRVLDVNAAVRALEPMLSRLIGEDVQLATVLADAVGCVRADEGQVEQILMNLAVNARDAMPRGGTLTIETAASGAGEIAITVRDTGLGMDAATLAHVFEPFFTTKPVGEGTGLGLATVHGIVHQSGGRIEVESEPGRGTAFRISLPRVEGSVAPVCSRREPSSVGGHETILLVEDDAALRSVTVEILQEAGYVVRAAAQPVEALALCASEGDGIDLLLTDVVMPGLSGPQLASRILSEHPGLRVLYVSGYTDEAVSRHGLPHVGALNLLQKPFSASDLLHAVRAALSEPVAGD